MRRRPVYNQADDFVLVVSVDAYSFPSGHASRCHTPAYNRASLGFFLKSVFRRQLQAPPAGAVRHRRLIGVLATGTPASFGFLFVLTVDVQVLHLGAVMTHFSFCFALI